jgi:hypothetical protein
MIGFLALMVGLIWTYVVGAWPLNGELDSTAPSRAIEKMRIGGTLVFGFGFVYFSLGRKAEEWFGHPTAMDVRSLVFLVPLAVLAFGQFQFK